MQRFALAGAQFSTHFGGTVALTGDRRTRRALDPGTAGLRQPPGAAEDLDHPLLRDYRRADLRDGDALRALPAINRFDFMQEPVLLMRVEQSLVKNA